jgi:hypothetical protein
LTGISNVLKFDKKYLTEYIAYGASMMQDALPHYWGEILQRTEHIAKKKKAGNKISTA